ncbi:MAG: radical SAM protein with 4Fe4S-binding SPASM domain [Planctomycetota bacterium]|jgi:radical SAM protein with 4Fe4S-binding SPASM domain
MTSSPASEDQKEPDLFAEARVTGINPLPIRALQIETSSICNFRCNSCVLSLPDYDRPAKHMSPDEFARVLDAFPTVEKIEMQGIGEVFLNPQVFDLIRIATDRGIQVQTFSNASVIDREMAHKIVESGIAVINFSMDGADEETFRKLRKGGTLERYKRCLNNIVQAKRVLGSETPRLGMMCVLAKNNMDQVPKMVAIAEELGVSSVMFTKLNLMAGDKLLPIALDSEDTKALNAMPAYKGRVEVITSVTPWTLEQRSKCYWPQSMAYVTVEGHVTPCCNYLDSREMMMGSIHEKSGDEIWNDEPYREFRKSLLAGNLPTMCQNC